MFARRPRLRFVSRALLAALALLSTWLTMVPTAAGAEVGLEVLRVGWDGNMVPGTWTPVRVRVTGGAGDLGNARVEVVLKGVYQPGPQTTLEYPMGAFGQEIALPAAVEKEVTLWVLSELGSAGNSVRGAVRLMAGGQALAEEMVEFRATKTPYWPLVGVLADSPAMARTVSQIELPVQGLPIALNAAGLSATDLPSSGERLRAFSALAVQGNAAATLTGEQRQALLEWVSAGGHLLLAGGPGAARAISALPQGSLPVSFSGVEGSGDLSAMARWTGERHPSPGAGPISRFNASTGSLLAGAPDNPLAWRLGLGQGTVTLLAADPTLEPLVSWSGVPALLRKALEPALPSQSEHEKIQYLRAQEQDVAMRIAGAVDALPPEAFPDWRTIALILGGFTVVVGPLAHLLLWRADRRGWIWLGVPGAALLLSVALYYLGVGRAGQDVLVNVVSHVRLSPDAGQARQSLVAGFYAPTHPQLTVAMPGDAPLRVNLRQNFAMGGAVPGGVPTEPPFHVLSGRDTRVEFAAGRWSMRSIALSRTLGPEAGRISAQLGLEGGLIRGTIRNDTPYPLEDTAVLIGQSLVKLGGLAPGQSAPVVLDPGVAPNPFEGRFPLSWRLFGRPAGATSSGSRSGVAMAVSAPISASVSYGPMPPYGPGMPERLELPQDPEVQRRVRLLDPLINVPRPGPGAPVVPLSFIAFTRAPVGGAMPSAGDHPTYYLTVLEQPLRLDLSPGPFTLPAALIPPELLEQTGGFGGGSSGTFYWVQLNSGSLTYGFRPPLPSRSTVDALVLTTRQVGSSTTAPAGTPGRSMPPGPNSTAGPAEEGVFSVYNWESATWEPLPGGREECRLEPAAPYLASDGLVKVRVEAARDRTVNFLQPELTVEGRVVE